MARIVPTKAKATASPIWKACSDCWRTDQPDVVRLGCDHVVCVDCMASRARVAMTLQAQLLPLRCCHQPVPAAVLAKVLLQPELVFYQHLTARAVALKIQQVANAATSALTTTCDFCSRTIQLKPKDTANLLPCGHVYCTQCTVGLRHVAAPGAPICCQEIAQVQASFSPDTVPLASANVVDERSLQLATTEATTAPPAPTIAKGKKMQPVEVTAAQETTGGDRDAKADACISCWISLKRFTTAVTAPCGHAFCRACMKRRCQHSLVTKQTVDNADGLVRCCDQLVPMDAIRPVLGKRQLALYEALFGRSAAKVSVAPTPAAKRKSDAVEIPAADNKRQRSATEPPATPNDLCVSCLDEAVTEKDQLRGPCGHTYCLTCLATMATKSVEDRTLVPIRCCSQEFPIEYVRRVLSKRKFAQYERFVAEKDWRASDLQSDREYARVVKKLRGKQCPTCGIGVQKISGCQWMNCPHGHTFCWKCATTPCTCEVNQVGRGGTR